MITRHRNCKELFLVMVCVLMVSLLGLTGCTPSYPAYTPSTPQEQPHVVQPPDSPSNLIAEPASQSKVNLQWLDNSNNEDGFKIYRDNNLITTLPANTTTYQDTGLEPATTYQYVVKACNQAGESSIFKSVMVIPAYLGTCE